MYHISEWEKLWNIKVRAITIVVGALERAQRAWQRYGCMEDQGKNRYHPLHWPFYYCSNTLKSWRLEKTSCHLVFSENHPLELVCKTQNLLSLRIFSVLGVKHTTATRKEYHSNEHTHTQIHIMCNTHTHTHTHTHIYIYIYIYSDTHKYCIHVIFCYKSSLCSPFCLIFGK